MRNKTTPVNPQTSAQLAKRGVFGSLSAGFRALSAEAIAAWNSRAKDFPYLDIFGDSRTLSGSQLFVKLNNNLAQIGVPSLTLPPNPAGAGAVVLSAALIDNAVEEVVLSTEFIAAPAARGVIIEATRPLSAGVRFYKNEFRQIAVSATPTLPTPEAIYTAYADKFGAPAIGDNIAFRISVVNSITGERSVAAQVRAEIS